MTFSLLPRFLDALGTIDSGQWRQVGRTEHFLARRDLPQNWIFQNPELLTAGFPILPSPTPQKTTYLAPPAQNLLGLLSD